MKLHEDINKKFIIYDNVIDETSFDDIFTHVNNELDLGNQSIRFVVLNTTTNTEYKIHQKLYNEFTDLDKEMFHKNYDNDSDYELLRRDCDIGLTSELEIKISKNIKNIVKEIYNIDDVEIENQSIIWYGPGYFMGIHSDSTPPDNPRLCTAVLYCNDRRDDNIGGDVIFYNNINKNIVHTYSPKRNQLVIFDSYINEYGIPHSVTKIENWDRYVYRIYFKAPINKTKIKII
jgi:Rps23 Pro-64 3,4-dihydroxylase Tpa1-like proline 4-hydroxylase